VGFDIYRKFEIATKREETKNRNLNAIKENVKKILSNKSLLPKPPEDPDLAKIREMAYAYEDALGIYSHKKALKFLKDPLNPDCKHLWLSAIKIAEELEVDYEVYIKAQFWCFEKWFKKAPKLIQLTGKSGKFSAFERVKIYLACVGNGKASFDQDTISKVMLSPKVPDSFKADCSGRYMKQMMNNFKLSEDQIYMQYRDSLHLFFDPTWLLTRPLYNKLKLEQKI
jgi:hypothetical protein